MVKMMFKLILTYLCLRHFLDSDLRKSNSSFHLKMKLNFSSPVNSNSVSDVLKLNVSEFKLIFLLFMYLFTYIRHNHGNLKAISFFVYFPSEAEIIVNQNHLYHLYLQCWNILNPSLRKLIIGKFRNQAIRKTSTTRANQSMQNLTQKGLPLIDKFFLGLVRLRLGFLLCYLSDRFPHGCCLKYLLFGSTFCMLKFQCYFLFHHRHLIHKQIPNAKV